MASVNYQMPEKDRILSEHNFEQILELKKAEVKGEEITAPSTQEKEKEEEKVKVNFEEVSSTKEDFHRSIQ